MKTLDELAILFGTDKATQHPTGAHGYTPHYDRLFTPMRDNAIKMLEIGVGGGESIRTWLEYFPRALVHGVDLSKDTNPYNTPESKQIERYVFSHGDQSSPEFWSKFLSDYGTSWDIIIDDGGHFNDQIITSFCALWGSLAPGGLYCVEDLGVCYGVGTVFVRPGFPSHSDFFKNKVDEVLKDTHAIDWMCLSKELAVIRKRE